MAHGDKAAWYRGEAERLRACAAASQGDMDAALRLFRMASQMDILADQLVDDEKSH